MSFIKGALSHVKFLIRNWVSIAVMLILLVLMLLNFTTNVNEFRGTDVAIMVNPMRLLTLSFDLNAYDMRMTGIFYIPAILSVFVSLPAGLSLALDRQLGMNIFLHVRQGKSGYYSTRAAAVFIVTLIIFSLPFLIEIVLNCIAFPTSAKGNFLYWSIYDEAAKAAVNNYIFSKLYLLSPYLYASICTLMFGAIAGLTAVFTYSLTLIIKLKYRIFYTIPAFVVFQISYRFYASHNPQLNALSFIHCIMFFDDQPKNKPFFAAVAAAVAVFVIITTIYAGRKDVLNEG